MKLTERDRVRLAVETGFSLTTIVKWSKGGAVAASTDTALLKAAGELGIAPESEDHDTEKAAP